MPTEFDLPVLSREELLQQIKARLEGVQPWSYSRHALFLCKQLMEKNNAVNEQDIQQLADVIKRYPRRRFAYYLDKPNTSTTLFFNNKPTIAEVLIRQTLCFLKNQQEKMCVTEVSL